MEKVLTTPKVTNFLIILCTLIFIKSQSLPICRKVMLLLETSDDILGTINTMIYKLGLISQDP